MCGGGLKQDLFCAMFCVAVRDPSKGAPFLGGRGGMKGIAEVPA